MLYIVYLLPNKVPFVCGKMLKVETKPQQIQNMLMDDIEIFLEGSDIVRVPPNTYYQPKKKQQVGIDSFFVYDSFLGI